MHAEITQRAAYAHGPGTTHSEPKRWTASTVMDQMKDETGLSTMDWPSSRALWLKMVLASAHVTAGSVWKGRPEMVITSFTYDLPPTQPST